MKRRIRSAVSLVISACLLFSIFIGAVPASGSSITADAKVKAASQNPITGIFDAIINFFRNILNFFRRLFGIGGGSSPAQNTAAVPGTFEVSVKCADGNGSAKIKIVKNNNENFLYLPSFADSAVGFSSSVGAAVKINDVPVEADEQIDISDLSSSFKLGLDDTDYDVTVCRSDNISAAFIETESGSMDQVYADKAFKEPGSLVYVKNNGECIYDNALEYIKGRGNSSWKYAKKGFNIKLEKSTNLDSLGKNKKWSLIPDHIDKSLLRNQIAYDLAREVGVDYTPEGRQVDLYLNGQYNGTYLLVVKTEISKASVNITDLEKATENVNEADLDTYPAAEVNPQTGLHNYKYYDIPNDPEDITGGYLLEIDASGYPNEPSGFMTSRDLRIVVKCPEYASKAQVEYIGNYYQEFEDAVFSPDGRNALGRHYSEYIDLDSFVRYYLLTEFLMNGDSHITSVFLYKESELDGDGLLHAGPAWDYDSSLGNNGGTKAFEVPVRLTDPEQQFYNITIARHSEYPFIYSELYRQQDFRARMSELYSELFVPAIDILLKNGDDSASQVKNYLSYVNDIEAAADMNFKRWQIMNNNMTGADTGKSYSANTDYLLSFMNARYDFMNRINDAVPEDYLYIFVLDDEIFGITSFEEKTVELYDGTKTAVGDTVTYKDVEYTVASAK